MPFSTRKYHERFAYENRIPLTEVLDFARLGRGYALRVTHELNGDAHHHATDPTDKNENAKLWGDDAHYIANQMDRIIRHWGFDHLDFGVGLYPTIQTTESDTRGTIHFVY